VRVSALLRRIPSGKLLAEFRTELLRLEGGILFWWGLLAFVVAAVAGLLHWILTDPDADRGLANDRFRLEQESRALRRAGKLTSR
jgi:hypothetical protein